MASLTLTNTVAEMKAWHGIYDPDNEDAITNEDCIVWINTARRRICRTHDLRFSEASGSFGLMDTEYSASLPARWKNFTDLFYLDAANDNARVELKWFSDFRRFKKKYPDASKKGDIKAASQWGSYIFFGPTCDTLRTITWYGHVLPADLTWGGSPDDMMEEMREAIMFAALVISGEHQTVPETKHNEWKTRAGEEEAIAATAYRTSKQTPGRIVTQEPGTIIVPFEEE